MTNTTPPAAKPAAKSAARSTRGAAKAPPAAAADPIAKLNSRVEQAVQDKAKRNFRAFPACSFEEALEFARQMFSYGSGQPVRRISLFDHLKKSPDSGPSRQLITNANKYGLTEGGYQADHLKLTPEGIKCVDEESSDRERTRTRIALAIEGIEPFKLLFQKYVGTKLPARAALIDQVKEFEIPSALAEEAVDTFMVNLRFVGLLQTLSGAERVVSVDHLLDGLRPADRTLGSSTVTSPARDYAAPAERGMSLTTSARAEFDRTCFYITPIGAEGSEARKHSDMLLGSIVEPALESFGLTVVRADGIDKPGTITRQIIEYVLRSRLVIADLSFHNPNVFYELAIRHAARLPVVQLVRAADRIPFDVNQMRTIHIDTTDIYTLLPRVETYKAEIASQVRRALDDPDAVDNPISVYYPGLKVHLDDQGH